LVLEKDVKDFVKNAINYNCDKGEEILENIFILT
jgi:hypothetical protein